MENFIMVEDNAVFTKWVWGDRYIIVLNKAIDRGGKNNFPYHTTDRYNGKTGNWRNLELAIMACNKPPIE